MVSGSKRENHKGALLSVLLIVCLLMIYFSGATALESPKDLGLTFISVFQKGVHSTTSWFSGTLNSISELADLRVEYQKTLTRLQDFEGIERQVLELKRENDLLREQLNFSPINGWDHISSEIIAKDPENIFTSIVINRGTIHGVRKGMPVTAFQDGMQGLIGKVVQAGINTSLVMPLFSRSSYVAARLQKTRYEGLIRGTGSSSDLLIMNYVKKTAADKINLEDLVITSGMSTVYPKGVFIGRIKSIFYEDYDTSLEIRILPIINFSKLEYIYVLSKNEKVKIRGNQ